MQEIILATGNAGKINELSEILSPIQCIPQGHLNISNIEETGLSFVENALLKARHASKISGKAALADDSGLVVKSLHGAPGIHSARFAGAHASDADNLHLLLKQMQNTPDSQRQAFFYCAIVLVRHAEDPIPLIAVGNVEGTITRSPLGEHGFGYDPVFFLSKYDCTMAQLPAKIKNTMSHRANALHALRQQLEQL